MFTLSEYKTTCLNVSSAVVINDVHNVVRLHVCQKTTSSLIKKSGNVVYSLNIANMSLPCENFVIKAGFFHSGSKVFYPQNAGLRVTKTWKLQTEQLGTLFFTL